MNDVVAATRGKRCDLRDGKRGEAEILAGHRGGAAASLVREGQAKDGHAVHDLLGKLSRIAHRDYVDLPTRIDGGQRLAGDPTLAERIGPVHDHAEPACTFHGVSRSSTLS